MNNRVNTLEGLRIETSLDLIHLGIFPDDVCLAPAECEIFTQLVAMARGMERLPQLPPFIQSTPFRAYFEKRDIVLIRKGQKGNGLKVTFKDADKAIRAANIGVQMYKDAQIHRGETSPIMGAVSQNEVHDPGFEGLD